MIIGNPADKQLVPLNRPELAIPYATGRSLSVICPNNVMEVKQQLLQPTPPTQPMKMMMQEMPVDPKAEMQKLEKIVNDPQNRRMGGERRCGTKRDENEEKMGRVYGRSVM